MNYFISSTTSPVPPRSGSSPPKISLTETLQSLSRRAVHCRQQSISAPLQLVCQVNAQPSLRTATCDILQRLMVTTLTSTAQKTSGGLLARTQTSATYMVVL